MREVELKFQVPPASVAAVRRAVATASARVLPLRAVYADTPDDRLAAARLALRLRREGRTWVQTLKGPGDGLMQRLEHEVTLPAQRGTPAIDPARHAGTPAGEALARALAGAPPLEALYRTEVRRTVRRVRHRGAVVELAFDEGRIEAGGTAVPVCELEFELVAGPPAALLSLAAAWAARHGLWWDVRTKSERGHALARGTGHAPPRKARAPSLDPQGACGAAFAAIVQEALGQVLANAAPVADASGDPEHLHQLRVGLRRLRSALRLFADWSADPAAAHALEARLREPFVRLGATRDDDVLAATLLPALAAAGGPPLALPVAAAEAPATVVREPGFSVALLDTLALAIASREAAPAAGAPSLAEAARAVLRRAWRRARDGVARFASAEPVAQHDTRKRLKRLRYAAEFLVDLLPPRVARLHGLALRAALDAIGEYTDLLVAEQRLRALVADDPRAWFGLGWLAARREPLLAAAVVRLSALAKAPRPWRRAARGRR